MPVAMRASSGCITPFSSSFPGQRASDRFEIAQAWLGSGVWLANKSAT